jgi:excisionase family DNA binding protein
MPKNDDRNAVSIREAARLADVSPITIRREIERGVLVDVRLRGKRLVLRESLERALKPKK